MIKLIFLVKLIANCGLNRFVNIQTTFKRNQTVHRHIFYLILY